MIQKPTNVKFFVPQTLNLFDATAEPTLEGIAGEDYQGNALASTDQVINAMDSHSRRPFQADTSGVTTRWRVDTALTRETRTKFWMLDGHNLRDVYPVSLKQSIDIYQDTNASFAGATEITPNKIISGLLGRPRPYVRLNGITDKVIVPNDSPFNVTTGDFGLGILFMPYALSGTQYLSQKYDAIKGYGLYLVDDDLYILMNDSVTGIAVIIGAAICEVGDLVACHVNFDRSGNASAYVSLNGGDKKLVGTVNINNVTDSLSNTEDLDLGENQTSGSQYLHGRIYWYNHWTRVATSDEIDDEYLGIIPSSGVALQLSHDGLDASTNNWKANEGNLSLAVVTGDIIDCPTGDDRGFYLAEFEEVDKRYYFTDINSLAETARAVNALIGQIVMGQIYQFNGVTPTGGFSGSDEYPGIMIEESVSGIVQAEERYGQKNTFSLNFQVSTQSDYDSLLEMNSIIKGMRTPLWVCFNYTEQMPVIWRVRAKGGIEWGYRHGPSQPWSASLELVMDI